MTERWHPTKFLSGFPGMPSSPRPIRLHGQGRGWVCREVVWGRRTRLEWLESSLPAETQAALREARGEADGTNGSPSSHFSGSAVAVADARLELLASFERWREAEGLALVPAFKAWVSIYREGGAGVSDEARELVPRLAWNTLQRWRLAHAGSGYAGLLPGSGGRTSVLDSNAELRRTVEKMLYANPNHTTARAIRRRLRAKHPDVETPSMAVVQRWVRRWRREHAHDISAVADPDGHRSRYMPAFGDGAHGADGLNALWELDSTR